MIEIELEQLQRDPDRALRAATDGPVFLTENGRVTHVLMSYGEYLRIGGKAEEVSARGR